MQENGRPGLPTVVPRMVVADVAAAADFLAAVFGATGEVTPGRPAELWIGDSAVLVSAVGERAAFPVFLYVYVTEVDRTWERALAAGARDLEAPFDTAYGERRAMVRDPFGNVFQLASIRPAD